MEGLRAGSAELVEDPAALEALAGDWRRLAEARGSAFLTPEWCLAWLRHYGRGARPALAVIRGADGALAGLLPLALSERRPGGGVLRFAGYNVGDRLEPVAAPGGEGTVVRAAAGALAGLGRRWTTLVLDNVDAGAPWCGELLRAWPRRLAAHRMREAVLPYVSLEGLDWDAYLARRSRNFRSQLGRRTRALEREHDLRFRRTAEAALVAGDLERFFRLHDARWAGRGGSSSASATARAFHADFAAAALERGWLRLWFLELDGEDVAAWYGWRVGGRYAYYLAGFDPRWERASVGLVLLAHTVRSAIEEGADEYDMLLGDEPYKWRFATAERRVETVVVTRALSPRRLAVSAEARMRRAAARLPAGVRERVRRGVDGALSRLPTSRAR